MENMAQSKTLEKPSASVFPYSRRPIRSRTYNALANILSNWQTLCPLTHPLQDENDAQVIRQGCEGGIAGVEFTQTCDENGTSNHDHTKLIDEWDDRPKYNELGVDQVQEADGIDKSKGITEQVKVLESDKINLVTDFLMDEDENDDCGLGIVKELKDVNDMLDFEMGEFSSIGQLEYDKGFSVNDFSDVMNYLCDDDMYVDLSKAGDATSNLPENVVNESEHRLQLKEMELEELLCSPRMLDSFGCVSGDIDIEEGEISGGTGEMLDELSEDAVSLGDKSTGLLHATEVNVDNDSNPSAIIASNNFGDSNTTKLKEITRAVHDSESQNVICERDKELKKVSSFSRNLEENDAGNQNPAAAIQDDDANKKKRKRGPLTKERKAKKKKKERILRAEKNRQLGVKRLKLPPSILKPKTVKHCRHYIQGRCHEGENCKFSHDVVPATKSKPCSYFARQSCMKGDDCPYDHELSKYPCNNYATKGFCGRGSDCLFSHEISANQTSPMTPTVLKPEKRGSAMILDDLEPYVKLARPLNNLNSGGKIDNCGIFLKKGDDAKLKSGGNSSTKKVEQVLESVKKTAKKPPKGVSFILHGGMPAGDPNKQRGDELSPTPGGNTDAQKPHLNGLISTNKSNEVSVVEARRKPRGINFLSFAQTTSLDDTSCKALSNLFTSGYNGKEKQSYVSSEGGKIIEASTQVSENVRELSEERSKNVSLVTVPLPVNNSTTGKPQSQATVNAEICRSLKTSPLLNTPSSVQKAVQSTLAFAAKFESSIKLGHS